MNRNLGLLIACQALLFTNNAALISVTGLAGTLLTPSPGLSTLPVVAYISGAALSTGLISKNMAISGRRYGFLIGTSIGLIGLLGSAGSMMIGSFIGLCFCSALTGVYNAAGQLYRFAAAEVVDKERQEQAISWVMAGGLLGGIGGARLASYTHDWFPQEYMGVYLALAGVGLIAWGLQTFFSFPALAPNTGGTKTKSGTSWNLLWRDPSCWVACLVASLAYGIMNLIMTSTPIAMHYHHHHPFSEAAWVLEWHVIGMFAPSFFTGHLIRRFGVLNIILVGCMIFLLCAGIALSGTSVMHFWAALLLLGIGWNFLFIGGTTLLTKSAPAEHKNSIQGANEQIIFMVMALSALSSGALINSHGWNYITWGTIPMIAIVLGSVLWLKGKMEQTPDMSLANNRVPSATTLQADPSLAKKAP